MEADEVRGRYVFEQDGDGERMRLVQRATVPPDRPPAADMPPLPLLVLDGLMDGEETLDTICDCGEMPPYGLALVGDRHLVEAARSLLRDGLIEVDEAAGPDVDDRVLLRCWYRPTPAGVALWEASAALLDRYYDRPSDL